LSHTRDKLIQLAKAVSDFAVIEISDELATGAEQERHYSAEQQRSNDKLRRRIVVSYRSSSSIRCTRVTFKG
jgi:hypothetical protein